MVTGNQGETLVMKCKEENQTEGNHGGVFCRIRDGLLEAIEFEKNCSANRMPFDIGADSSMDSPEQFAKSPPETAFIPAGPVARDAYGHRYGSELLELDDDMIDKLRQGQQLAVEIQVGEYILFIQQRKVED